MLKRVISILAALLIVSGLGFFGFLWFNDQGYFEAEETYDINGLIDAEYEAELFQENDELFVAILASDLTEEEALQIILHISQHEEEKVTGYVFSEKEAANAVDGLIEFYQEGLEIAVYEDENNTFYTHTFEIVENVTPDAEAIEAWEIDASDSGTEDEVLSIYGMVDQAASDKQTLAQIKGLAEMTERYNPDHTFIGQQYEMQRGSDILLYHTTFEHVLALKATFNVQIETNQPAE